MDSNSPADPVSRVPGPMDKGNSEQGPKPKKQKINCNATGSKKLKYRLVRDPIHGSIEMHPLLYLITRTPAFDRLKNIKQLGVVHYVYPGAVHTRFEHSVGVSYLAGEFARILIRKLREDQSKVEPWKFDKDDEMNILCVEIAGLCHDLGHGPFSHVFDPILMRHNLSHEKLSVRILKEIIYKENKSQFEAYGIGEPQIDMIENMICPPPNAGEDKYLYEIVAGKDTDIDVDKWDYFIRDCHYLGLKHEFDFRRLMQLSRVLPIVDVKGIRRLSIYYDQKEANDILGMFRTRCSLYLKAYKHKNVISRSYMLQSAIKEVLDEHIIYDRKKKVSRSIKDILTSLEEDLEGYLLLDDGVIHFINNHPPNSNIHIGKAQTILSNIINDCIPHQLSLTTVRKIFEDVFLKMITDSKKNNQAEKPDLYTDPESRVMYRDVDPLIDPTGCVNEAVLKAMRQEKERELIILKVKQNISPDPATVGEIIFAEKVKLSYGSKCKNVTPLHQVQFYEDKPCSPVEKRECVVPEALTDSELEVKYEQRLDIFHPAKYHLEEYWWYSGYEKDRDGDVIRAIAEALIAPVIKVLHKD